MIQTLLVAKALEKIKVLPVQTMKINCGVAWSFLISSFAKKREANNLPLLLKIYQASPLRQMADGRRQKDLLLTYPFGSRPLLTKEKLGSVEVKTSSEQMNFCPLPSNFCPRLSSILSRIYFKQNLVIAQTSIKKARKCIL